MQLCVLHVGRQPVRFGPLPPLGGTWQSNSGHQVWPRVALPTGHFIEPNKNLFCFWFQRLQSITGGQIWWSSSHHGDQIAKKQEKGRVSYSPEDPQMTLFLQSAWTCQNSTTWK